MRKLLFINILIFSISACGIISKKKREEKQNKAVREAPKQTNKKDGQEAPYHYRDKEQERIKQQKTEEKQKNPVKEGEEKAR